MLRRNNHLFSQLYVRTIIYIGCSVLAVSVPMLYMLSSYSSKEIRQYSEETSNLINNKLDSFFHSVEAIETTFATDTNFIIPITLYYKLPDYAETKSPSAFREADETLRNMALFQIGLEFLVVGKNGPLSIYSTPETINDSFVPSEAAWYGDVTREPGSTHLFFNNKRDYYRGADSAVTIIKSIPDIQTGEAIAFIIFDITYDRLFDMIREMEPKIPVEIRDPSGRVIFSNVSDREKEKNKYRMVSVRSDYTGVTVRSYADQPLFVSQINRIVTICLSVMAAYLLIVFLFLSYSTRRFTKPIYNLMKEMKRVVKMKDRLETNATYDGRIIELHDLYTSFNLLVAGMNDLIRQNYEIDLLKTEAELDALQQKINPHFLYNTLETISSQAILDGSTAASVMCQKLGSLFSYSLQDGDLVPLHREIRQIKDYLFIAESSAYYRDFTVEYAIAEVTLEQPIPKMTLQPIVENCFKHAFRDRPGPHAIRISSTFSDGCVHITIADNGNGMAPERLEWLRSNLSSAKRSQPESDARIGLRHVHARYMLYYDNSDVLQIESAPNAGFTVTLKLPVKQGEGKMTHA